MFKAFSKSNAVIKNGSIVGSDITMNAKVISAHGIPQQTTDVVNKSYCDQNVGTVIPSSTFILISNEWTLLLPDEAGDVTISIFSLVPNGPCGKFSLTKNSPSRHPAMARISSVAGSVTLERLEIRWRFNTGIEIRKNGQNYDGQYRMRYYITSLI